MYKYGLGTCPNSLTISEKLITLPLHMNLTENDIEYIIEKVIEINKNLN
jgi:dTDP-4-amino-4,6-dideoxygalactose transaminase